MPPLIFEVPSRRSTKMIDTSLSFSPSRHAEYFISIWKPYPFIFTASRSIEDGEKAETPIVCTCTEKCQAGAVNTACPVCVKNLSECVGTEQKAAEPTEPENPEPEKKSNTGAILAVLLILAAGGGAAVYFLVLKPKQGKKVPADLDDFDLEDEEEYLTEDEETEEKNE